MSVHDGHRERVKKKFLENGLDSFHEHEVLELLLFFALPRGDTNPIAHRLINTFGSLSAVLDAPYEELLKVSGVGQNAAAMICMMPQLCRRYRCDLEKEPRINSTEKAGRFLVPQFIGRRNETVIMVCVDNQCRVLSCQVLFEGSVNSTHVHVRKIIEAALKYNACGVVIAHNHPGGIPLPSREDILTTGKIRSALEAVDIELIDHIIVAGEDFTSLSDSKMIKPKY